MTVFELLGVALGGGTLGGVVAWLRFRKKDQAEVYQTGAAATKLLAESAKLKAEAETTVVDAALKLAERLTKEAESARQNVIRLEHELAITKQTVQDLTQANRLLMEEIEILKSRKSA